MFENIPEEISDKTDLSANAVIDAGNSHDIRTPLTGILGVMHLLKRTELDRNQRRYLDTATNSAKMLLANISDALSNSQMDLDSYAIEPEKLDLAELIEDVASILAPEAISKGINLVCDIDPKIPYPMKADGLRLRQLLNGLLENAIKNTDHGHVVIYVANNRTGLEIGVKNTGAGLHEDQRQQLLQPFTPFKSNTKCIPEDTRLRLQTCVRLIEAMDSKLQIESEVGKGSRFYFEISLDNNQRSSFDWKPPLALQQLSVAILSPLALQRSSIANLLRHWRIADVREIDFDVDKDEILHDIEPCDLLIIDQTDSEHRVNELIDRLRNNSDWRCTRFVHLIYQNRPGVGGSADVRLYKPISRSRLYAALMDIVYKLAFDSEYDSSQSGIGNDALAFLRGRRILLVEDNDINKMIVLEMLQETGVDVDVAVNGADAVERVQHQKYDLILMDIQMPVMDGYEATRRIRAQGGAMKSVPIIAMTAHAFEGDSSKSLAAGLDHHISKPFEPDDLIAIILRFIEQTN